MDHRLANVLKRSHVRSVRRFRALDEERDDLHFTGRKGWAIIRDAQATLTDEELAERFGLDRPYTTYRTHARVFLTNGREIELEAEWIDAETEDGRFVRLLVRDDWASGDAYVAYLDPAAVVAVVTERPARTVNPGDPDYDDG